MSFVDTYAPHLPLLRRYARALTGSQQSGDAYIRASLEAFAENPDRLDISENDTDYSPKVELYTLFHIMWGSFNGEDDRSTVDIHTNEEKNKLLTLSPISRQAFLLTSLEGFTKNETAKILSVTAEEVDILIDEAQRDIESQLRTKVLVIEDEPIIAADLETLVSDLGHEVTGNAVTHKEAVEMAKANPPGLVLCDIQLADNSSGIDAAKDILGEFDVPIIFITAFPEKLLTGERPEPTYLISKPFQDNTVKAAIGQALFFHPSR
ncbi:MAG: response regulator [Pseudomonadota bacterium]